MRDVSKYGELKLAVKRYYVNLDKLTRLFESIGCFDLGDEVSEYEVAAVFIEAYIFEAGSIDHMRSICKRLLCEQIECSRETAKKVVDTVLEDRLSMRQLKRDFRCINIDPERLTNIEFAWRDFGVTLFISYR